MGGGSALQTVCCWGEGVDCEIKIWQGVAEEMTGLPKKMPSPPPQLINNDRPLSMIYVVHKQAVYICEEVSFVQG